MRQVQPGAYEEAVVVLPRQSEVQVHRDCVFDTVPIGRKEPSTPGRAFW
jgi:hypothetical protein